MRHKKTEAPLIQLLPQFLEDINQDSVLKKAPVHASRIWEATVVQRYV